MGIFGKVWKKHSFGVALFCLILLFSSCSNGAENASLTLTFNGADFARTSARNITVDSDYKDYYLVVNILGDYTETKEIPFSEIGTYGVTFLSIPVGAKISVQANVYDMNDEEDDDGQQGTDVRQHFYHIYTGSSPEINIVDGYNIVSLSLKRFDLNMEPISSFYTSDQDVDILFKSNPATGDDVSSLIIKFYPNSKYQIIVHPTDFDIILSEGIWEGNFNVGNTITLQECIFQKIIANDYEESEYNISITDEYEINSKPEKQLIKIYVLDEEWPEHRKFTIKSQNGLFFNIKDHIA